METQDLAPSLLEQAMHQHLQAIALRPMTPRTLLELEKTCRLARELFAIGKMPDALQKGNYFPPNTVGGMDPLAMYESGVGLGIAYGNPAPMNQTETFGVQAIKELIALLPGLVRPEPAPAPAEPQMSYADMASAMAIAKGAGDDVLYRQLLTLLEQEQRRAELANVDLASKQGHPAPKLVETEGQAA